MVKYQDTLNSGQGWQLDDIDWSFPNADTQYSTHGMHTYPARMIPQIPGTLLKHYLEEEIIQKGGTLYDPFCGSGTSIVEANLHGLNGVALDINPFAVMLSKAKTTPLDISELKKAQKELLNGLKKELESVNKGEITVQKPEGVNSGWFPHPQIHQLIHIRNRIQKIDALITFSAMT